MHRNDGAGCRCNEGFQQIEVQVPCLVLRINWNGYSAVMICGERGCDVCAGADQNFVARFYAGGRNRYVQRGRAAAYRDAVPGAAIGSKFFLELRNGPAKRTRYFAPSERVCNRLNVFFADRGFKYGDHFCDCPTITLSFSIPRNGPCFMLMHCMSSITRMEWIPWINTIASPARSSISRNN